uniref:Microtubule-associated protein 2 n=1 Tax=Aceria tosichella TaxID=561515 RepID=A0A6G1S6A8_9ACAR
MSSVIPNKAIHSQNSDLSQASSVTVDNERSSAQPKRLPPIKAPVGLARSPDLKNCKSKIGSLDMIKHKPSGGRIKIETQKLNWNAKSKVGSLENKDHKPAAPRIKVETRKLEWKTTSKVQSLQNIKHQPGGGNVKIFDDSYREKSATGSGLKQSNNKSSSPSSSSKPMNDCNNNNKKPGSTTNQNNHAAALITNLSKMNLKDK